MNQFRDNFLYTYDKVTRVYKKHIAKKLAKFNLSPAETDVLTFLINNENVLNTARDISNYRGLSKGLVSKIVGSLTEKRLIYAQVDEKDKRVTRLFLTNKAEKITQETKQINSEFKQKILQGVSKEDLKIYFEINSVIMKNTKDVSTL